MSDVPAATPALDERAKRRARYGNGLLLLAIVSGFFVGQVVKHSYSGRVLTEDAFAREAERGTRMRLIIQSPALEGFANDPQSLKTALDRNDHLELASNTRVVIPDQFAAAFFGCERRDPAATEREAWFDGEFNNKEELYLFQTQGTDPHLRAHFEAVGTLKRCERRGDGSAVHTIVARGVTVRTPLHLDGEQGTFSRRSANVTLFAFLADLYVTFLLMLFVPTLAFSLLKSVIDIFRRPGELRFPIGFFFISSLMASLVGVAVAYVMSGLHSTAAMTRQWGTLADAFAGRSSQEYDPHPLLTQFGRIVPTSPLGALTDPNANSGLQIAFVVVLLGLVLHKLNPEARERVGKGLQSLISIFVHEPGKRSQRTLSDLAHGVLPYGVFFLTVKTVATLEAAAFESLGWLMLTVIVALAVHLLLVVGWLVLRRDFKRWWIDGAWRSREGFVIALATASSYAALPKVREAPLMESDLKSATYELGTTVNKNGTAVYLASAAAYLLFAYGRADAGPLLMIVALATFAGISVAGLPFAAVFGLRSVLSVSSQVSPGLAWLIVPIDPVVDRVATFTNVFTNLAACSDKKKPKPAKISAGTVHHIVKGVPPAEGARETTATPPPPREGGGG